MKQLIITIIFLSFFACTEKNNKKESSAESPNFRILSADNIDISDFKKDEESYIILFDGQSTKGWRGYGKDKLPSRWKVINNCLTLTQNNEEGGNIVFDYKFKNFELELEWMISKAGNSGIFYLGQEVQSKDIVTNEDRLQPLYVSALEYQILDNEHHPDAQLGKEGNRKPGSLYDMIAAKPQTAKPYGEWNRARIIVNNGNVSHWLNETKVVEYSFLGQQWIDLLQTSKFGQTKWPLAFELMKNCGGENHEGYIGLQDMGDEVFFRKIRIKILN